MLQMLGQVCKVQRIITAYSQSWTTFILLKNTETWYCDLTSHTLSNQNQLNVEQKRHHHPVTQELDEGPYLKLLGTVSIL